MDWMVFIISAKSIELWISCKEYSQKFVFYLFIIRQLVSVNRLFDIVNYSVCSQLHRYRGQPLQ